MVGAQGKGLRTSEQVETKVQGKSVWSGHQYRPLDGTDRLKTAGVYSRTTQEDKLGLSSAVITAYILSTQGQVSLTLRVSSECLRKGGRVRARGSTLIGGKGVIGTEGHGRQGKEYVSASDEYETGVMGVGMYKGKEM